MACVTYEYDLDGLRTSVELVDGATIAYGYDTLNRLTDEWERKRSIHFASQANTWARLRFLASPRNLSSAVAKARTLFWKMKRPKVPCG